MLTRISTFLTIFCLWCFLCVDTVAEEPSWRVVTEIAPPMQYMEDGELKGSAVTLVKQLVAAADLQADIEIYPWARAFGLAKTRKNTLIFSMVRNPEREPYFHWIGVVNNSDLSFISLRERSDIVINSVEDAKRLGIGAVRDAFNHQYLLRKNFKLNKHFLLRSNISELIELLFKGRIDVVLVNYTFFTMLLQEQGFTLEQIKVHLQPEDAKSNLYLAANKDSDAEVVELLTQLFAKKSSQ